MTIEFTAADILAASDVVDAISEASDRLPIETAAEMRVELIELKKHVATAIGLLETQMMNQLEDAPRRIGDKTYEVVDDGVYRADHDVILDRAQGAAFKRALNPETGEVNPGKALENLVTIVRSLYLSPSTTAKVGGIDALGLDKRKVRRWEKKGRKLQVIDHHPEFS